ncbi:MAG: hypothetical protein WKF29_03925 [Thermoleophilaceae bacterium]
MNSRARFVLWALALSLCLLVPPTATAAPRLWATVNACDTQARPDTLGIRASMPGNGTKQRLFMRFQAQFYDQAKAEYVNSGPATRWFDVGDARFRTTQAGYSFEFDAPPIGTEYTLRGLVFFQYRARRDRKLVVVKRARRITEGGLSGVERGDPRGRSEASCVLRR